MAPETEQLQRHAGRPPAPESRPPKVAWWASADRAAWGAVVEREYRGRMRGSKEDLAAPANYSFGGGNMAR